MKKNKLFDFAIGNPPYQDDIKDSGNKTYAAPVYNIFVKISNVPLRALIVNCILFLVDIYPIPKYTCLRYDKHFI